MQLDQIDALVTQANYDYSAVMNMAIYERTYYLQKLIERRQEEKEAYEAAKNKK